MRTLHLLCTALSLFFLLGLLSFSTAILKPLSDLYSNTFLYLFFFFFIVVKRTKGFGVCHPQISHSGSRKAERKWEEAGARKILVSPLFFLFLKIWNVSQVACHLAQEPCQPSLYRSNLTTCAAEARRAFLITRDNTRFSAVQGIQREIYRQPL